MTARTLGRKGKKRGRRVVRRRWRGIVWLVAAAVIVLVFVFSDNEKASEVARLVAAAQARYQAALGSGVHLFSFALPARPPAKPATVSLLVEYAGKADRAATCGMAPRVRDAVIRVLWSHPLAEAAGSALLGTIAAELATPVNRALGSTAVRRVVLFPGDRPLDANDALRTPFAAVDECPAALAPPPNS